MKMKKFEPSDDPYTSGVRRAIERKAPPSNRWKWLIVLLVAVAALALVGCSKTRNKETVGRQQLTGTIAIPLPATAPDGTPTVIPTPVTFNVVLDSSELEKEQTKASIDRDEVKAMIADGLKAGLAVAKMSPAGPALNGLEDVLGWALGGTGLLAAAGAGIKASKSGKAVLDAVAFGNDVVAMLPKDQADAVKDKHRERQKKRGTNGVIKSAL